MGVISWFYTVYVLLYATFLWIGVVVGAYHLYNRDRLKKVRNELSHPFYFPISIVVPAYNEEVTISDTVHSLLDLDYKLYEIIVVDDGSKDRTSQVLIDTFDMRLVNRPIHKQIPCKPQEAVYETTQNNIKMTLIRKQNGGKGDALNMGINASQSPYFLCIDADSMLQSDSLEKIVKPLLEDDTIVAVGGLVRIAQCVQIKKGKITHYSIPWGMIVGVQVMEYIRSFFISRILMDWFNGNMIISGAFGLFKKDIVVAIGGYDTDTLGEDMELVVKMHLFCRQNNIPYKIKYQHDAVCWSECPSKIKDLITQRRRWHLGLFQSLTKYRQVFANHRFGLLSFTSYVYYLFYELLAPLIEILGLVVVCIGTWMHLINTEAMLQFFIVYSFYNVMLTLTAFFQTLYVQHIKISTIDIMKAFWMCMVENFFFRYVIALIRMTAFFGYKKRKKQWGQIQRVGKKANIQS